MWEIGVLISFGLTIVGGYWLAWDELEHVPIKLSRLGQGQAYPLIATGFSLTGLCLFFHHLSIFGSTHYTLLCGDLLACGIGIVNAKSGWKKRLHSPLVLVALSNWIAFLLISKQDYWTCSEVTFFYIIEHIFSYVNHHFFPNDRLTFCSAALCQYLCILSIAPPLLTTT